MGYALLSKDIVDRETVTLSMLFDEARASLSQKSNVTQSSVADNSAASA